MNFKKWAIQKLLKWSKILDIEKALRDKYHEGVEATEKKYEGKINVWWDPTVRSYPQPQKIVNPRGSYFKARHLEFMPVDHYPKQPVEPFDRMPKHAVDHVPVIRTNTDPLDPATDFPEWLIKSGKIDHDTASQSASEATSGQVIKLGQYTVEHMTPAEIERVPTIRDLVPELDPLNTDEYPAVVKLLNQDREQRRHAG